LNRKIILAAWCGIFIGSPSYARVLNSTLRLKVYARGNGEVPDRLLGFTPSHEGHPVRVPAHRLWYVRPLGALDTAKLKRLARQMQSERIPGLDLSDHWELTNDSLAHFAGLDSLVMLDISRTKISDEGLAHLKSCRKLTVLILPIEVSDAGLATLKPLRHLRELNLDQTHITDKGLAMVSHFPNLTDLDLSSTHVSDAGVALLRRLPHLERLVLGPAITDASAPFLAALKNLREIDVSQTQLGGKGIAALGQLPVLRTAALPRQVTDLALKGLARSPSLRVLDLTRTAVKDSGIKYLSRIETLEEVALGQTAITNASLPYLARLSSLRMLELSDTRVTSAGLAPLARLRKLEVLSLSWQKLEREDLQGMAKLKQLKTIVLNGVPLPETTMVQLRKIGTPSPWDTIQGIEHAALHETKKIDQTALSAPVPRPATTVNARISPSPTKAALVPPGISRGALPKGSPSGGAALETPATTASAKGIKAPELTGPPHEAVQVASVPSKPEPILPGKSSAGAPGTKPPLLKEAGGAPKPSAISPPSEPAAPPRKEERPGSGSAPIASTSQKASEENLLQVISLQSNPAHAGGFYGLSGMRQLRQTESLAALNTISDGEKANIADQEDKPENSLGEISVGARRSR
jgi:hypothetical protein